MIARLPTRPAPNADGGNVLDLSAPSPPGLNVSTDLSILTEGVRVDPEAPGLVRGDGGRSDSAL